VRTKVSDWRKLVAIDPKILGGKPVLKGTRVPVQIIVGSLAGGMSVEGVCDQYRVTPEQVHAALAYAAEILAGEHASSSAGRKTEVQMSGPPPRANYRPSALSEPDVIVFFPSASSRRSNTRSESSPRRPLTSEARPARR